MSDEPHKKVWWLAPEETIPDDYKTVTITSKQIEDPDGTRRFLSDSTCPAAKVWVADLERGGVVVKSDLIWPHHPPLDVVLFHLPEEDFKRLLGRTRGEQEEVLRDAKLPVVKNREDEILGGQFNE
jgi:hypothetical protein